MPDIVLDTNALADFLAQYFRLAPRGRVPLRPVGALSQEAVRRINQIQQQYELEGAATKLVVASSLAFAEIARKWNDIVHNRFSPSQLAAFLEQPPEWFSVAPVDEDLIEFFCDVPPDISTLDGDIRPIEWTDAVHVATAFSRGDGCLLATADQRLRRMGRLSARVV